MIATLPDKSVRNGRNYWGDKECTATIQAVVLHEGKMRTAVTVRVHCSRSNSRNYCSVWINDGAQLDFSGHGWAGGWGYHRPSAAMQKALQSCGVSLDKPIDGYGEGAMRDAVRAICAAMGFAIVHLVEN